MRTFLNAILAFIGSESLTDEEYATVPEGLTEEYTTSVYEALKAVLQSREGVTGQLTKLNSYFAAKGVDVTATTASIAASQIFLGAALD